MGYEIKEMLGKVFTDFQNPKYAGQDQKEFNRILKGKSVTGFETVYIGKDGKEIYLVFSAKLHTVKEGNVTGTSGTAFDITERKKAEEKIKNQLDELLRWHEVILNREERILELKREINDMLTKSGKPIRYTSVETDFTDTGQINNLESNNK